MNEFCSYRPYYFYGFKCGPSTYEDILSRPNYMNEFFIYIVHVKIKFSYSTLLPFFTFHKYNPSMNGIFFASFIHPYIWLIAYIILHL